MANLMEVDWHSLPQSQDDGAANHLGGARITDVPLTATDETSISLAGSTGGPSPIAIR
ncbi:MAG TPA: hypothetical protein VLA50_09805 [Erythrobacter sp.]|nr:hypothetical protein [Erythrobacter sp.]